VRDTLQPGLRAHLNHTVGPDRTVPALLPESEHFAALPPILATGYLVALVEWACMAALDGHLDPGEQTLGVHVDLSHAAPTPIGADVVIDVELILVDGRQLTFDVRAHDDAGHDHPRDPPPRRDRQTEVRRTARTPFQVRPT
jgi:fluoroacetyl-CoA thioesterase